MTTLDAALAYAESADDDRWSPRRTLLFVVGVSASLWSLIGLALWILL